MATEADEIIWEKYADNDDFSCEIYKNTKGQFDLFTFRYHKPMNGYCMMPEHRYLLDTMDEAVAKAEAMLAELVAGQEI